MPDYDSEDNDEFENRFAAIEQAKNKSQAVIKRFTDMVDNDPEGIVKHLRGMMMENRRDD